jgi:hypothetical protein
MDGSLGGWMAGNYRIYINFLIADLYKICRSVATLVNSDNNGPKNTVANAVSKPLVILYIG